MTQLKIILKFLITFNKISLIIVLGILAYVLIKYPKPLKGDLEIIRYHYRFNSIFDVILNFIMVILYFLIFGIGLLILRSMRMDTSHNLLDLYQNLLNFFKTNDLLTIFVYTSVIILFVINILLIFAKIRHYYNESFHRFHLYLLFVSTRYQEFFPVNHDRYTYRRLLNLIPSSFSDKKVFGFTMYFHLSVVIRRLHYIVLILAIIYDIIYNDWTITLFFQVSPYMFIYYWYIRYSEMYNNYASMYAADEIASKILYSQVFEIIDAEVIYEEINGLIQPVIKEGIILDNTGLPYDYELVQKVIAVYLRYRLDATIFEKTIPDRDNYHFYRHGKYCYITEWKVIKEANKKYEEELKALEDERQKADERRKAGDDSWRFW